MAEPRRLSPLADAARPQDAEPGLRLVDRSDLAVLDLRGDGEAARAASEALALALPDAMNSASEAGGRRALRLGPDEWLLLGAYGEAADLAAKLDAALRGRHAAVVDLSDRFAAIEVEGAVWRDVLNAACPLDLHPRVVGPGFATRSVFGKADVVLVVLEPERALILTNRSFAPYVWDLLIEAGREFGLAA